MPLMTMPEKRGKRCNDASVRHNRRQCIANCVALLVGIAMPGKFTVFSATASIAVSPSSDSALPSASRPT